MPIAVTLDDKYLLESGRVYLTGTQALVRLPLMQRQRDLAAGLNTACYISSYALAARGFDRALWQPSHQEEPHRVPARRQRGPGRHRPVGYPAIHTIPARYDGVFGMVQQGPGVDRSGDVLKHAN